MAKIRDRITPRLRACRDDCRGAVALMVALSLPVLAGFAALSVDVTYVYWEQDRLQVAADAAALAAANNIGDEDDAVEAAIEFAEANAVPDVLTDADVEFGHFDEATSTFTAGATPINAVRTTARRDAGSANQVQLFFARIIGFDSIDLAATAIAAATGGGEACILALDPSASASIEMSGTVDISLGCGLATHSTHGSQAMKFNGTGTVDVTAICAAGGVQVSGTFDFPNATPTEGCTPPSDPLAGLTAPPEAAGGCDHTNFKVSTNNGTVTLSPGVYCKGIEFSGNGNDITFLPGVYVLGGGGFKASGANNDLNGDGIMFYNTTKPGSNFGDVDFSGDNTVTFSAPMTGDYAGVLFFQDPSSASAAASVKFKIAGTVETNFDGAVYFPDHEIDWSGTAAADQTCLTKIIGATVKYSGTVNIGNPPPGCASDLVDTSDGTPSGIRLRS
ncbi:MAG: TadG family pilus assembly protein [Alphaproteobacteria bacterium]